MTNPNTPTSTCIIPARLNLGSKRFPKKNLSVDHKGKPIIRSVVEQVLMSKVFDHIVVSSDSREILDLVSEYKGVDTFYRGLYTSRQDSAVWQVVDEVIEYDGGKWDADYLGVVYPLAWGLESMDIQIMWEILTQHEPLIDGIMATCRTPDFICDYLELVPGNTPIVSERITRILEKETVYDAGYCYIYPRDVFIKHGFYTPRLYSYELDFTRVVDINHPWELEVARSLMAYRDR